MFGMLSNSFVNTLALRGVVVLDVWLLDDAVLERGENLFSRDVEGDFSARELNEHHRPDAFLRPPADTGNA